MVLWGKLEVRVAVITGGSSEIDLATAELSLQKGGYVWHRTLRHRQKDRRLITACCKL